MSFRILKGSQLGISYLPKIMDLDIETYSYLGMEGELEQMEKRYRENEETFIVIENSDTGELAGYINFFPVNEIVFRDIMQDKFEIRDDDIEPSEMTKYEQGCHIYIISIVIREKYRGKEASKILSDAWIDYLNELGDKYGFITREKTTDGTLGKVISVNADITGTTVSDGGKRFLRNHMFTQERHIENDEVVCICEKERLVKLFNKDLYFKSHKDDVYLMLPFADYDENVNEKKLRIISEEKRNSADEIPLYLINQLEEKIQYECDNIVANELENLYLGSFDFLHTTDDYEQREKEIITGEEKVHFILTMHSRTRMYILTILIPDCKFSTSQIEDQLSYGYLKIRNPANHNEFVKIEEYLEIEYGLDACGKGKTLLCMSNKPKNENEFQNIMAAETYSSVFQKYKLQSEKIKSWCDIDYTQYESYSVYLSNSVIVYIPDGFPTDIRNRIEQMSSYAFIALLTMFQNTSLARINAKVSNALAHNGEISNKEVLELYKEFGKTIHFWEKHNYKYVGAQLEAECIANKFGNDELKALHQEQQEFLEKIINLQVSEDSKQSGFFLNVMATVFTLINARGFIIEIINSFYQWIYKNGHVPDVRQISAAYAFNLLMAGGVIILVVVRKILNRKRRRIQKRNLHTR